MSNFQFLRSLFKFNNSFSDSKMGGSPLTLGLAASPGLSESPGPAAREAHPGFPRQVGIAPSLELRPPESAAPSPPAARRQALAAPAPTTALVHDYLAQSGGAERVVVALHALFPEAPLYTSVYDPKATLACFAEMDVRTSFLQRSILSTRRFHKLALGLYPLAFEQFDFTDYELVISSASSFAKGVITSPETCHICYCHTPARFAWRQHEYLMQSRMTRLLAPWMRGMISDLRRRDFDSAQRVDHFVANSYNVAARIRKHYRREVDAVIYPPVETHRFRPAPAEEVGDHFLVVSRLVGYKRIDLAVEACTRLGAKLRIVGTGPELRALQRLAGPAGPTIEFLGRLSDAQVAEEYARCRALIFPGEEDFGLTPVECMASGRPIVAYGRGGALETVTPGKTGVFFEEQTPESLAKALQAVALMPVDPALLQAEAFRFDTSVFAERMSEYVRRTLAQHRSLHQQYSRRPQ